MWRRSAAVLTAAGTIAAAVAAPALAATKATKARNATSPVKPRNAIAVTRTPAGAYIHGERFAITLLVTLKRPDKHAYLLSFIQFSLKPCTANAGQELQRTLSTHGAYLHRKFSRSPYTTTSTFTAGAPGSRRVCAYLFRSPIPPGSNARPTAVGTAAYSVTR